MFICIGWIIKYLFLNIILLAVALSTFLYQFFYNHCINYCNLNHLKLSANLNISVQYCVWLVLLKQLLVLVTLYQILVPPYHIPVLVYHYLVSLYCMLVSLFSRLVPLLLTRFNVPVQTVWLAPLFSDLFSNQQLRLVTLIPQSCDWFYCTSSDMG